MPKAGVKCPSIIRDLETLLHRPLLTGKPFMVEYSGKQTVDVFTTLGRHPCRAIVAVFVAAAALAACGGGGGSAADAPDGTIPSVFTKQSIDLARYPDATCNDGSPAVFYLQAGAGSNASADNTKAVIYLEGGGYCSTDSDCRNRPAELSSSKGYPDHISPGGLLSSEEDNPFFRSWNRVVVPYCTSDAYSGDTGPTGGNANFRFRGSKVVAAVIQTLDARYGIGKAGDVVLFGGSSAGAIGAFINANRVRSLLPGAKVLTLIDAGVYPDIDPPAVPPPPEAASARALAERILGYWNGQLDPDCIAANAGMPHLCYLFEHASPTLSTPVFVAQNSRDPNSIGNTGFIRLDPGRDSSANVNWINSVYLPAVARILGPVTRRSDQSVFDICEPGIHVQAPASGTWTQRYAGLGGASLEARVAAWAAGDGATSSRSLIDSCRYP